jgi:hypothetical protein
MLITPIHDSFPVVTIDPACRPSNHADHNQGDYRELQGGMGVGVSGPGSLHCAVLPLVVYRSSGVNMVPSPELLTL